MISAVVCTYNRSGSLRNTLQSLKSQQLELGVELEIVVVDNNSTDHTKAVVEEEAANSRWPIRYFFERRQGKSHALNTAIQTVRGRWVMFTDDDIVVTPKWTQALLNAHIQYQADCVGGPILPVWPGAFPKWFEDEALRRRIWLMLGILDRGCEPIINPVPEHDFLYGGNFSVDRRVFHELGMFRTDLGPNGNIPSRGEDSEFLQRLFKAKKHVVYLPEAIVYYHIPLQRMSLAYLRRRCLHGGRTSVLMGERPPRFPWWLLREAAENGVISVRCYLSGQMTASRYHEFTCLAQLGQLQAIMGTRNIPKEVKAVKNHQRVALTNAGAK